MKKAPYFAVLIFWSCTAILSGCARTPQPLNTLKLQSQHRFQGLSNQETTVGTPIADMEFDDAGALITLAQDSGRITLFDSNGLETMSCVLKSNSSETENTSVDAVAIGVSGKLIYMLAGRDGQVQVWDKDGALIDVKPLTIPLSPGDVDFGEDGLFYHSSEGLSEDSLLVAIDEHGKQVQKIGAPPTAVVLESHQDSVRKELANGQVPAFLQNSVMIATGTNKRIYALHRTRPLLKCFQNGELLFTMELDLPELEDIRRAVEIRNKMLDVPAAYIPFSYWADVTVATDGSLYLLLALQTRHTIYRLDGEGRVLSRIVGDYGKGHLLAVHENRLAIADAAKAYITYYALPGSS